MAPHVAHAGGSGAGGLDWILPIFPFSLEQPNMCDPFGPGQPNNLEKKKLEQMEEAGERKVPNNK